MSKEYKIEIYINEQLKEEQVKIPMLDYSVNDKGNTILDTRIYEYPNQIGIMLLDFIQQDLKEFSNMIFRYYGFHTLLTENERHDLLDSDLTDTEELNLKMDQLYNKYKAELESYKKQIINIIEYCIFNENEELKTLTPLDKLTVFCNESKLEDYTILKYNQFSKQIKLNKDISRADKNDLINNLKDKNNNRYGIKEIYEIDNFYNFLFLELYFILQQKTYLKKCKNCGKYFLTTNSAVIYCNNTFEDNKTCREIGASKVFSKNLENDEAYNLYRKTYKRKQALAKNKGGNFEMDYNKFRYQGKDKKNAYKLNEISKEEFMEWLNKQ
ncbi:MAG: hypothetical protein HFJ50_00350 [Clostridia bacterium]|jgi:hypothetical protein|nr:hypothetical protein [Clostridia bacterium]